MTFHIRTSTKDDSNAILCIHSAAFGHDKEAVLVNELMADSTTKPTLSLIATDDNTPVGHILFTRAVITDDLSGIRASILAPLAVAPSHHGRGIGGSLVDHGVQVLHDQGVDLIFVLGHPSYYPKHGFTAAEPLGFTAPHSAEQIHPEAWMVRALTSHGDTTQGQVQCAEALDKLEHWRE